MPAPQGSMLSQLTKNNFSSKGIKVPMDWQDMGGQYPDSFKRNEKKVTPNAPGVLFGKPSYNKYHVNTSSDMNNYYHEYIDKICSAISSGIGKWMMMAKIVGVEINGSMGMLMPGNVMGPELSPLIIATAPMRYRQERKYSRAIANGLGKQWKLWHFGITGTLNYPPLFDAYPGPMAPPTPNMPSPLMSLPSAGEAELAPDKLTKAMENFFGDLDALYSSELFESISKAFSSLFQTFKTSTTVSRVMGKGPVPVPSGPVVKGSVVPAPGVFN